MRTLNVFKLARNADYNVGSPDGTTRKSLSSSSSSTSSSSSARTSFRNSKNNSTHSTSSSNSSASRKSMTSSSIDHHRHPSYIQIDPDSLSEYTMDRDRQGLSSEANGSSPARSSSSPSGQNGNGVHDKEPETYKRLINEAPFLTTAREPPLDLDTNENDNNYEEALCSKNENDTSGGGGGTGEDLTDGSPPPNSNPNPNPNTIPSQISTTVSSITNKLNNIINNNSSTSSNNSNSNNHNNSKSISRSVSSSSSSNNAEVIRKTESRISMSTSTKSTSPSFDLELEWVDKKLIKEGRAFVRKHFLSVMFAHFIGMTFLLCVRPVAAMLLRNGKFHKPAKRHNWHMYLLLFRRLKSWYEKGDLTDVCDPITSNILNMRRSICSAGKNFKRNFPPPAQDLLLNEEEQALHSAVRDDLSQIKEIKVETKNIAKIFATVNPDVPWSQYDLAVTQFAFFGFISLFPWVFGIHNPSKRELQAFHHLWATLGQLLGLENRFNLCKEENFDEETNRKIFKHVFLFSFQISDNGSYRMIQLMSDGCKWFTIFITRMRLVLLFMIRDVAQLQSTNLNQVISWYDKVQYVCYIAWSTFLVRIFFLRMLGNMLLRILIAAASTLLLVQNQWRSWRMKRRKNQEHFVVFPTSIGLHNINSDQPKA